jgi:ribonuclease HI
MEARGGAAHTTNNRMEMMAAIEVLKSLKRPDQKIEIRSDSKYLIDMSTKWMAGWKGKGWKRKGKAPIQNLDLVKELDQLLAKHQVTWSWVRGHSGEPGNEYADQLTNDAMDAQQMGIGAAQTLRHPVSPLKVPRASGI